MLHDHELSGQTTTSAAQYDIVIPNYVTEQSRQVVLNCLTSIRLYSANYRLIFTDNASPCFDSLQDELARHPHLLISNSVNEGFVKAVNQGLRASAAPYVVLLNNDTEVVLGWLERLRSSLTGSVGLRGS